MACRHVAAGGDGLQVWKVAANILNKQSQTADKGWSSSLLTKIHEKPQAWTDMRFGTWNVRSMYRAGLLRVVVEEMSKY
jgi:hypothetical protein